MAEFGAWGFNGPARLQPKAAQFTWCTLSVSTALLAGCSDLSQAPEETAKVPPGGWRDTVALAGGRGRDTVIAALPPQLTKTAEAGIENQISSYSAPGFVVRFDYGADDHPGCERAASRCQIEDRTIGGRAARASISSSADAPFRTVHEYFVGDPDPAPGGTTTGSGLQVTIKCAETPSCRYAEAIVAHIRFRPTEQAQ